MYVFELVDQLEMGALLGLDKSSGILQLIVLPSLLFFNTVL
jgi:hypothetical protein